MTRLAFSTNAFKKQTLAEAIDAIADAGYRGVEVMADVPHAWPEGMGPDERRGLLAHLGRRGLKVSNVNAFTLFARGDTYRPTWIEDDADGRRVRVEHTIACVELAAQLGSATVSLQPGGPMIGTGLSRAEAGERFAAGLRAVLPEAARRGITLAVEPEPGLFVQTSQEYAEFKRTFFAGEPRVRMNCDVGHLYCVGEDPAAVLRTMAAEVAHVHLEDIGDNRVHQHLAPGKGAIDFPAIFAALRETDYPGWATVELYPYEATAAEVAKAAHDALSPLAAE